MAAVEGRIGSGTAVTGRLGGSYTPTAANLAQYNAPAPPPPEPQSPFSINALKKTGYKIGGDLLGDVGKAIKNPMSIAKGAYDVAVKPTVQTLESIPGDTVHIGAALGIAAKSIASGEHGAALNASKQQVLNEMQKTSYAKYFGKTVAQDQKQSIKGQLEGIAGQGGENVLNVLSWLGGAKLVESGVSKGIEDGFNTALPSLLKEGAKTGAKYGGAFGATGAMANKGSLKDIVENTVLGISAGGVVGGALEGAAGEAGNLAGHIFKKTAGNLAQGQSLNTIKKITETDAGEKAAADAEAKAKVLAQPRLPEGTVADQQLGLPAGNETRALPAGENVGYTAPGGAIPVSPTGVADTTPRGAVTGMTINNGPETPQINQSAKEKIDQIDKVLAPFKSGKKTSITAEQASALQKQRNQLVNLTGQAEHLSAAKNITPDEAHAKLQTGKTPAAKLYQETAKEENPLPPPTQPVTPERPTIAGAKANRGRLPVSTPEAPTEPGVNVTRINADTGQVTKSSSQAGSIVNPASPVLDMIDKHNKQVDYTNDLQRGADAVEGRKKVILSDAAKTLKNRPVLSNEDKATIQNYRDNLAAGKPTVLPEHLREANDNITALNREAQKADAARARLEGNEAKARTIESRDPATYTHRVTRGKGSAFDYLVQGDRRSPVAGSGYAKGKPGDKSRAYYAATDENGDRHVVAVKNSSVKVDGKTVARGKVATKIEEGGKTATDLGKVNLKTDADRLAKELKPLNRQLDNLTKEKNILSSTKSRTEAASTRLKNIDSKIDDLNSRIGAITDKYDPENLNNRSFDGKDGHTYTLGEATTDEITKATGQQYYTDPEMTSLANYIESKNGLENAKFIDAIKTSPEAEDFMSKEGTAPKGWQKVNMDQFRGYRFEPRTADTLNNLAASGKSETDILDAAGRFLRQTIVYFPVRHMVNELAAYATDRGLTGLVNPVGLARMFDSLIRSLHDVMNQGPMLQELAERGFSTPSLDSNEFNRVASKQIKDLVDDSDFMNKVAKDVGSTPQRLAQMYAKIQHTLVWQLQDVLNEARVRERMAGTMFSKGMTLEEAARQTEKFSFQYKVPARVMNSRQISRMLQSDKVFFGRYAYDKWKIVGNIIKDSVNVTNPKQAAQALDKLALLTVGATVMWPVVNKGIQAISGDPNAHIPAPGPGAIAETIDKVLSGQEHATTALGQQLYISGIYTLGMQIMNNMDTFTGEPIADRNASATEQGEQTISWLLSQMAPAQKAAGLKNAKGNIVTNTLMTLSGVSFPKNSPETNELDSLKYDSLHFVESEAKAQAVKGNFASAQSIIDKYDSQVVSKAEAAIKSTGQPVPDQATLIKDLKAQEYYYAPKQSTVRGWQTKAQKTKGESSIQKLLAGKAG